MVSKPTPLNTLKIPHRRKSPLPVIFTKKDPAPHFAVAASLATVKEASSSSSRRAMSSTIAEIRGSISISISLPSLHPKPFHRKQSTEPLTLAKYLIRYVIELML